MPKPKYIQLAFPPSFFFPFHEALFPRFEKPYFLTSYYTNDRINQMLASKYDSKHSTPESRMGEIVEKDLPRTRWQMVTEKVPVKGKEGKFKLKFKDIASLAGLSLNIMEGHLTLTTQEINALSTFAISVGETALQGGFLKIGSLMCHQWFREYQLAPIGHGGRNITACKNKIVRKEGRNNQLDILHSNTVKRIEAFEYQNSTITSPHPIIKYHDEYCLQEDPNGFRLTINEKKYAVLIEENFWNTYVLSAAQRRLNNITRWTKQDIFALVPCLCDASFVNSFMKKLKSFPQDEINHIFKYIDVCFAQRPLDRAYIQQQFDQLIAIDKFIKGLSFSTMLSGLSALAIIYIPGASTVFSGLGGTLLNWVGLSLSATGIGIAIGLLVLAVGALITAFVAMGFKSCVPENNVENIPGGMSSIAQATHRLVSEPPSEAKRSAAQHGGWTLNQTNDQSDNEEKSNNSVVSQATNTSHTTTPTLLSSFSPSSH